MGIGSHENIWSRAPLAGMVASEVAITVSIELLARRAHLSLATILVDRSLLALALLALIVRPTPANGCRALRALRCCGSSPAGLLSWDGSVPLGY